MKNNRNLWLVFNTLMLSLSVKAAELSVVDEQGLPVGTAMVTRTFQSLPSQNLSDEGYPPHGVVNTVYAELSRFTGAEGHVNFDDTDKKVRYRIRKPGYQDRVAESRGNEPLRLTLVRLTDPVRQREQQPSNTWLSMLDFDGQHALKKQFQLNCAFCHQQASAFMRAERSSADWLKIIERMEGYGSRFPQKNKALLADILSRSYRKLREHPERVPLEKPWADSLSESTVKSWPIGDGFSQMHDFVLHPNGMVYVGDNLQDRIYELDPETGHYRVYKVPREETMQVGGILGNRFSTYGKINNYMGVHSFAVSPTDGHIFITPSMQRSLLEFDPQKKTFTVHKMAKGYYPHTIRADQQDRIWFTLALSSQVGMWDRKKKQFTYYDLPARTIKEWLILKALPLMFSLDPQYRPQPSPDDQGTGIPMPYGIDIAPDGTVWVARLYANDIAKIDPQTGEVTMIKTPWEGPRRLRVDGENNVWIVAFQASKLLRYNPASNTFTDFDLPVVNELPYALNVDKHRGIVWVNGNQSDTLLRFAIATEQWTVYPMPRRRFFSRDIEIDEQGAVYTTNSHFPAWQIEDGQPTLVRLTP